LAAVGAGVPRSLLGRAISGWQARNARTRAKPALQAVREHLLTVCGLAAIDVGMFHAGAIAGWVAVGVSLLVADFQMRG
jgi:hypothetical protein